jgi:hypothetical protein
LGGRFAGRSAGEGTTDSREGEDDWLVRCEESVEIIIRKAVRMLGGGLQLHQIHDVDHARGSVQPRAGAD